MGLEDLFNNAVKKTYDGMRASFSGKEKWKGYLQKYDLKDYFHKDVPLEQRQKFEKELGEIIDSKLEYYKGNLSGMLGNVSAKGSMGVATANSLYAMLSSTAPLYNIGAFQLALFAGKTLVEIPALYNYIKKSRDWYGALGFIAAKPIRALIPVLGPMLEAGAFDRMVKKRIIREAKLDFVKKFGDYKTANEYFSEKMQKPLGEIVELPQELDRAA